VSVDVSLDRAAQLVAALEQTTAEISHLLESVADAQDWRPNDEHWSFRHIAAHLEACQTECVLVRVRQIAAGAKPKFEFYDNDGWDFSDRDLRDSVREWRESRARVFSFVRSLSQERLSRTGSHRTFGEITVLDYLNVDLDHDREHLADLKEMLGGRARSPSTAEADRAPSSKAARNRKA
jgi:hypothetical protein